MFVGGLLNNMTKKEKFIKQSLELNRTFKEMQDVLKDLNDPELNTMIVKEIYDCKINGYFHIILPGDQDVLKYCRILTDGACHKRIIDLYSDIRLKTTINDAISYYIKYVKFAE